MRNLKRVLSLALAAIMLMVMMVMGTSAASVSDFTDADEITNLEAASVTTAIDIFSGYGDGSFGGENYVNRAEMATIICKILLGSKVNADVYKGLGNFQDLTDYAWAEGYINMCYSQGIVNGTSNTTYEPGRPVKTWEAALMLQRALGWWAKNDPANSTISELTVSDKSKGLGLYGDLTLYAEDYLTRNDVAEMVFNAITKCVPVEYNESFKLYRNAGSTGLFSGVVYEYTATPAYTTFGLVYKSTTDAFGRTATSWGYGTGTWNAATQTFTAKAAPYTELTVVPEDPVLSYTNTVRQNAIYSDLGLTGNTTFDVYVDGVEQTPLTITRSSNSNLPNSGRGVQTLVYENTVEYNEGIAQNNPYTIVVINTYVMNVDSVTEAKGNTPASVRVGKLDYNTTTDYPYVSANFDPKYETDAFVRDDVVLITVAVEDHGAASDKNQYKIQSMQLADSIDGTLTSYSRNNGTATVGGTVYNFAAKTNQLAYNYIEHAGGALRDEVTVYLDNYGNAVDIQKVGQEMANNYALVLAVDKDSASVFDANNAWAKMLLMDGSVITARFTWEPDGITPSKADSGSGQWGYGDLTDTSVVTTATVDKTKSTLFTNIQTIVTYDVDRDGVYTLNKVDENPATGLKTENNESKVQDDTGRTDLGFLNAASVLIVPIDKSKDQYRIYTGVKEIPTVTKTASTSYVKNTSVTNLVDVIYIDDSISAASKDLIYVVKQESWTNDQDLGPYVTFTVVMNGEKAEVKVKGDVQADKTVAVSSDNSLNSLFVPGGVLTSISTNADGIVKDAADSGTGYTIGCGIVRANRNVIGVGLTANSATYFTWSDDVKVVYVGLNNSVDNPRITNLQSDPYVKVIYNTASDNAGEIVWMYVVETSGVSEESNVTVSSGTQTFGGDVEGDVTVETGAEALIGGDVSGTVAVEGTGKVTIEGTVKKDAVITAEAGTALTLNNIETGAQITVELGAKVTINGTQKEVITVEPATATIKENADIQKALPEGVYSIAQNDITAGGDLDGNWDTNTVAVIFDNPTKQNVTITMTQVVNGDTTNTYTKTWEANPNGNGGDPDYKPMLRVSLDRPYSPDDVPGGSLTQDQQDFTFTDSEAPISIVVKDANGGTLLSATISPVTPDT